MSINSHFIPTPGIENLSNTLIIQRLIQERIRSTLMKENMVDNAEELCVMFLAIPPTLQTPEDVRKYLKEEAKKIVAAFHKFEKETPEYHEAIRLLKEQENKCFKIVNVTYPGILILLEDV